MTDLTGLTGTQVFFFFILDLRSDLQTPKTVRKTSNHNSIRFVMSQGLQELRAEI